MSSKCGCPSSGSEMSKDKCDPPGKNKGNGKGQNCKPGTGKAGKKKKEPECHESRKKFLEDMNQDKNGNKDKHGSKGKQDKCGNNGEHDIRESKVAKDQCGNKGEQGKSGRRGENEKCHESHKGFKQTSESDSPCSDKTETEKSKSSNSSPCGSGSSTNGESAKSTVCVSSNQSSEDGCNQSQKAFIEPKCMNSKKIMPTESASCPQVLREDDESQSMNKSEENIARPCKSERSQEDGSLYSKFTSCCKSLAQDMMNLKEKCIGSGSPEKKTVEKCPAPPPTAVPCPPKTEKRDGVAFKKQTCGIAEEKPPCMSDFFPIDARNKKLNDCVDKYMKIDPKQVMNKCSQFASHMEQQQDAVKCSGARKVKCVGGMPADEAVLRPSLIQQLLTPKRLALASRWAPTAGVYLATTGLVTLYLTEWRAVLQFVPGYYHLGDEPLLHKRDDML